MERRDCIPAAQYLRMSTEHQRYSLENQTATIHCYAQQNGFEVVDTYSDGGKSGVLFKNRPALNRLLQDVIGGRAGFNAILVYDVSRWGRFQDSDEAAHYEFICKHANVPVHYCAERFGNDNALSSTVMKAVKRAMAAEFSRELGDKVLSAGKQWAERGFKQGGPAGYALQRLMVSSNGTRKQLLAVGEMKCLQNDRVVLVPGDPQEVECVREIFRLLVEEGKKPFRIAKELNQKGIGHRGRNWSHQMIYSILTHPKYAGSIIWNRHTRRLGSPDVRVPESDWIVKLGAFEAVIDPRIYAEAQRILNERRCRKSNDDIVEELRRMLASNGLLSRTILRNTPGAPSITCCRRRFGSLQHAFALAGYAPR
jgi:DNA invertase Pin-like site-specific DNA recombinase